MFKIPQKHIEEFITLYENEFQKPLSFEHAQKKATHLLEFLLLFFKSP